MAIINTTKSRKNTKQRDSHVVSPIKSITPKKVTQKPKQTPQKSQIISGYFIEDQSYKQMVIERINTVLYAILGSLICVCLLSYYFVTIDEIKLNKIQKETLSINYANEDLQNQLDYLQSYHNVDRTVSQTNLLRTAEQVIELPEKPIPIVNVDKKNTTKVSTWALGY